MVSLTSFLTLCVVVAVAASSKEGINGYPCRTATQCLGTRTCYYIPFESPSSFGPCNDREACFCGPVDITDLICFSDDDCTETGEVCASFVGFSVSGCISLDTVNNIDGLTLKDQSEPEQSPALDASGDNLGAALNESKPAQLTPTPFAFEPPSFSETDGIQGVAEIDSAQSSDGPQSQTSCIGVHHLHHLPAQHLLYDKHVSAKVLCDQHNNCATPGHMVRFDEQAMMMKSYCAVVVCDSRVMLVNSPKYSPKLSVASKLDTLQFTAFAARYEWRVEEKLLSLAVHLGL